MAEVYRCRSDDNEDLTKQVQDAILRRQQFFRLLPKRRLGRWKVVVTCSHGHENVFEGTGWSE